MKKSSGSALPIRAMPIPGWMRKTDPVPMAGAAAFPGQAANTAAPATVVARKSRREMAERSAPTEPAVGEYFTVVFPDSITRRSEASDIVLIRRDTISRINDCQAYYLNKYLALECHTSDRQGSVIDPEGAHL